MIKAVRQGVNSLIPRRAPVVISVGATLILLGLFAWSFNNTPRSVQGWTWHVYFRKGAYFVGDPAPAGAEYVGYTELYPIYRPWPATPYTPLCRLTLDFKQYMVDYPPWSEQYKMIPDTTNLDWLRSATLSPETLEVREFGGDVSKLGKNFIVLGPDGPRQLLSIFSVLMGATLLSIGWRASWRQMVRRERASQGRCESCGYDRYGVPPDAKCPECGAAQGP